MGRSGHGDSAEIEPRATRIREIVGACLQRWAAGEALSVEPIVESHPDLMPELAEELRKTALIAGAGQLAAQGPDEGQTADDMLPVTPLRGLHICCPHCHQGIDIAAGAALVEITYASCGGTFSLLGRDTKTRDAWPLKTVGHFELVSQLGTVWKAYDTLLDRTVAVQIPHRGQLDPVQEEQFFREARVAVQLKHPNIVGVHKRGG